MARKPNPAATPQPTQAQVSRAARLRSRIQDISSGVRPAGAPPKSPREMTDEAARRKWEEEQKKKA